MAHWFTGHGHFYFIFYFLLRSRPRRRTVIVSCRHKYRLNNLKEGPFVFSSLRYGRIGDRNMAEAGISCSVSVVYSTTHCYRSVQTYSNCSSSQDRIPLSTRYFTRLIFTNTKNELPTKYLHQLLVRQSKVPGSQGLFGATRCRSRRRNQRKKRSIPDHKLL